MWTRRAFAALPAIASPGQTEPKWQVSDNLNTTLNAFVLSPDGLLAAASDSRLFTSRDGFRWQQFAVPSPVVSVAFSSDTVWIVTSEGLHASSDSGKTWKLSHKAAGLNMVYFADAARGFATGDHKTILETSDSGETWQPMPAAGQPTTNPETTTYHWIDFVTPRAGVITGASRPPRKGNTGPLPAWRDPKKNQRRPEWPGASLTLETRDGGKTWKNSSTSIFGRITRVRYARDGKGIALVEFHDKFDYPSEVFSIDLRTGASERCFRRKDRAVTDILLFSGPVAVLGSIEPPSNPERSQLGSVRMHTSTDLKSWTEQPLEKDVSAGRVWLAGLSDGDLWAATDTGTLLRWKR